MPTPWGAWQGNRPWKGWCGDGEQREEEGVDGAPCKGGAAPVPLEPTCLCPWELCPGPSALRLGLCRNLAISPRVPRQTLRSPRDRVVLLESCSVTFLEGSALLFPAEPARSSGGESQ